jgi:hypothetical protein
MSSRHQASRRRAYGRRRHELRERGRDGQTLELDLTAESSDLLELLDLADDQARLDLDHSGFDAAFMSTIR